MTIKSNGFTLIEVLLAMSLLSLLVVLLAASLRIGADSWEAGEQKSSEVNQKAVVYQFFKRHIPTMRPLPVSFDPLNPQESQIGEQVFQGQMQRLRFVAGLPAASARKGLQVFEVYLDPNNNSRLLVQLTPYMHSTEPRKDPAVLLLDHIQRFEIAYFGKLEEMAEAQWQNEWMQFDRLPSLIRISIQLDDQSYWPDMLFAVVINDIPNAETIAQ